MMINNNKSGEKTDLAKLEDNICIVLNAAKNNIKLHRSLRSGLISKFESSKEHIKYLNDSEINMVKMLANNCFFESLSLIYNLFKKDSDVYSFKAWSEEANLSKKDSKLIKDLREDFSDLGLARMRHNIGDHINIETIRSPEEKYVLLVNKTWLSKLKNIIEKIEENIITKMFEYSLSSTIINKESEALAKKFSNKVNNRYLDEGNSL